MKGAHSISTRRAYGVQRVCRVWHRARSSVYDVPLPARAVGAAPDDVLVGHIGRMLDMREGYRTGRSFGSRESARRVRRLMREHDLRPRTAWATRTARRRTRDHHHRGPRCDVGHGHRPRCGSDAAFVFVAVDHCTTECIGLHAAKRGTRFEALIRQGVRERFGEIGDRRTWPTTFNRRSRSSASELAEFRAGTRQRRRGTLQHAWVRSFDTIEELRLALLAFKRTYNEQWMLEKYHYRSPAQVRRDLVGLDAAA